MSEDWNRLEGTQETQQSNAFWDPGRNKKKEH